MNHTLYEDLVWEVLSGRGKELSPEERLWIVTSSAIADKLNQSWLADLYMLIGCYEAAMPIFREMLHWRKLGDIAFALDNFDQAKGFYAQPAHSQGLVPKATRVSIDWDRLFLLAFIQGAWEELLILFRKADLSPTGPGEVALGNNIRSNRQLVQLASIAQVKAGKAEDADTARELCKKLGTSLDEWETLLAVAANESESTLKTRQAKAKPTLLRKVPRRLEAVLEEGTTERARRIQTWIVEISERFEDLRKDLDDYLAGGKESVLSPIIEAVTDCGSYRLASTVLFRLPQLGGELKGHVRRVIRVYESHPFLTRYFFAPYVSLKLRHTAKFSPRDLLTAIFQHIARVIPEDFDFADPKPLFLNSISENTEGELNLNQLKSCEDWAEIQLGEWLSGEGASFLPIIREVALDRSCRDIRLHPDWVDFVKTASRWLAVRWRKQFGEEQWVSESQLFQLLKARFKGHEVLRNATPAWISPQHLDIYMPALKLAVEYMGVQHYKPVEFFGGAESFRLTVERDRRKADLCSAAGVDLIYVRYDQALASQAEDIWQRYASTHDE